MTNHENGNIGCGEVKAGSILLRTLSEMAKTALKNTTSIKEGIALNRIPFGTLEEFIEAIRNAGNEDGLVSTGLSVGKCRATAYWDKLTGGLVVKESCTPEEVPINLTQTKYERNDEGIYTFTCPILKEGSDGELLSTRGQYVIRACPDGGVVGIEEFYEGRRLDS